VGPKELRTPLITGAERLLIVSPVRNEASHIEPVVRAVAAQTRPPDLWLVADDNSEDDTLQILRYLEGEIDFLRVVTIPPARDIGKDRLAMALEAKAFNRALEQVEWRSFTHIGKLDGDIELPPDYFERILSWMRESPDLGIAGGSLTEPLGPGGEWKQVAAPGYHVHGAMKLFTRGCFEAVGGIQERLGWDVIDETYARIKGYRTARDPELVARHYRPGGSADGRLRGQMRHGEIAYISRYSLPWVLARAFKIGVRWDPYGLSGLAFVWGYFRSTRRRTGRVEDKEFKRFVRREHRQRVLRAMGWPMSDDSKSTPSEVVAR
jgi:glycosyltransferase involved in cell wall biosynthesis